MKILAQGALLAGLIAVGLVPAVIDDVAPGDGAPIRAAAPSTTAARQVAAEAAALSQGTALTQSATPSLSPSLREDWMAPQERLTETLERPLFSSTRRPPKVKPAAAAKADVPVDDEEVEADTAFALAGVVLDGENSVALLQDLDTREYFHVRKGDVVDGWRVEAIRSKVVLMVRGDNILGVLSPYPQAD